MKKVYMICMAIFFCAAVASADPVEEGLPKTATQQVKNSTRQMITQGFNTEDVIELTRQMLASNFSQQQVLQANAILMDARQQGLQTEPIMSKAQEGLAKQVQAKAVLKAMEQVRSRHEFAQKQAKAITNDRTRIHQMAAILAGSMAAGMKHEDTGRIMQALQQRTQNMTRTHAEDLALQTFMTTRTAARLGMQSESVGDSVCQALQQGYSAQEMHTLQNTMMTNSRHSFSESFSRSHSFNAGQHGGQEGMGGHGGDSGGGMGGGSGGGMGGGSGGSGGGGGGMGGGNM
ncbi:MAG: hypothetical protein PVG35_05360 [Desulfobacterales bacterium]|jgi:hypothetical protein